MNVLDLFKLSTSGCNYWERLQVKIKAGYDIPLINKINQVFNFIKHEPQQLDRLRNKFKVKSDEELLDVLTEVMVFSYFLNDSPEFTDDKGKPDIFLRRTKEYVEVKRVRISDEEIHIRERFYSNRSKFLVTDSSSKLLRQEEKEKGLLKKIEKIDQAVEQINKISGHGIVFLSYSLDLFGYLKSQNKREKEFETEIRKYFHSKNQTNIKLIIKKENDLFAIPEKNYKRIS